MDTDKLNKKWVALEVALRTKYQTLQSQGYRVVSSVQDEHVLVCYQNAYLAGDNVWLPIVEVVHGQRVYRTRIEEIPYPTLAKLFSRSVLEPFLAEIERKYQADQIAVREAEESRRKAGESIDWAISILQRGK